MKLFILIFLISVVRACMTSTLATGTCTLSADLNLTFCKGHVSEYVCIPLNNSDWPWDIYDKETEVRSVFVLEMENIMNLEAEGITSAFSTNSDCTITLIEIMCRMNIPYCINDTSYNVCGAGCTYLNQNCIKNIKVCDLNADINSNNSFCEFGHYLVISIIYLYV